MNVSQKVCFISEKYIDENTARFNAFLTFTIVLIFLLTPIKWIIFLLAADFLLRRIMEGRLSVISRISILTTAALA